MKGVGAFCHSDHTGRRIKAIKLLRDAGDVQQAIGFRANVNEGTKVQNRSYCARILPESRGFLISTTHGSNVK